MRRIKKFELKVFKLRSGEEIIAKVSGKSRDKIKLLRPMRIINNIQTDPYSGVKRHVVFFSDWIGSSSNIEVDIPIDFIVVELLPDPDMIQLYIRQSEVDDEKIEHHNSAPNPSSSPLPFNVSELEMQKMSDDMDKKLDQLLKQFASEGITGDEHPPTALGIPPLGIPSFPPFPFPKTQNPEGILFSISIPNDILISWIETGVIDYLKDCMGDFINIEFDKKKNKREKISKDEWIEPTDDLKNKPNYGNSHEDWSPYLKDYLPKKDPPKKDPPKNEDKT